MYRLNPLLRKLKRGPQVILPKDLGVIFAFTGVGKKSVVVDAGAGSGFLALSLANICKKVVTYERREEFAELVKKNITRSGLKNITVKLADVFEGISERDVDLVSLDLAEADRVVCHVVQALRPGGFVSAYLPHAEQVKKFVDTVRSTGEFEEPFVVECIMREMLVREEGFRPETKGLLHTAYLAFARKKEVASVASNV